jgi:hypothetical protein
MSNAYVSYPIKFNSKGFNQTYGFLEFPSPIGLIHLNSFPRIFPPTIYKEFGYEFEFPTMFMPSMVRSVKVLKLETKIHFQRCERRRGAY